MSDPFQDAAKRATRAAEKRIKDAADPNTSERIQHRIAAHKKAREEAGRPDPSYPWPKRFYEL